MSKTEHKFREMYPNARHVLDRNGLFPPVYTVYAGDCVCASACTRSRAYAKSLEWVNARLVTPDPTERATTKGHPQ